MAWVQVPFRGAAGGGAVASTQTNPFTMPHVYASALERKVQAVEDMRRGVKVRRQDQVTVAATLPHSRPVVSAARWVL